MLYLETGSTDPSYNLAFEEHVLAERTGDDYLLLWQNAPVVVIGRHQNPAEEVDGEYMQKQGIRFIRRNSGGGAVYHDFGNLNFSLITDHAGEAEDRIQALTARMVEILKGMGLEAESTGRNDIEIRGRKISGTAQHILGSRLLYHGTLLFDADLSVMGHILRPDPAKFESKSTKSVRGRVGNIRSCFPQGRELNLEAFREQIRQGFDAVPAPPLSMREQEQIEQLRREKYESWEWNTGRTPAFDYRRRQHFPGGTLEILLQAEAGRIREIRFAGDYLALRPSEEIAEKIQGLPLKRSALDAVLPPDVSEYFGGIGRQEVLELICSADPAGSD